MSWFGQNQIFGIPADALAHFILGLLLYLAALQVTKSNKRAWIVLAIAAVSKELIIDFSSMRYTGRYFESIKDLLVTALGPLIWMSYQKYRSKKDKAEKPESEKSEKSQKEPSVKLFPPTAQAPLSPQSQQSPKPVRWFAIGDLHCQFDLLKKLIAVIDQRYSDSDNHLIFMGDVIDRARSLDDCQNTIMFLQNLKETHPKKIRILMGNHEVNFLKWLNTGEDHIHEAEDWEQEIYRNNSQFLSSFIPFFETEEFYFAHAGGISEKGEIVRETQTPEQQFALFWNKEVPDRPYPKTIVRGHKRVSPKQMFGKYLISTDLGAYISGRLGAAVLPDRVPLIVERR